jgi:hypothetical protein
MPCRSPDFMGPHQRGSCNDLNGIRITHYGRPVKYACGRVAPNPELDVLFGHQIGVQALAVSCWPNYWFGAARLVSLSAATAPCQRRMIRWLPEPGLHSQALAYSHYWISAKQSGPPSLKVRSWSQGSQEGNVPSMSLSDNRITMRSCDSDIWLESQASANLLAVAHCDSACTFTHYTPPPFIEGNSTTESSTRQDPQDPQDPQDLCDTIGCGA